MDVCVHVCSILLLTWFERRETWVGGMIANLDFSACLIVALFKLRMSNE